MIEKLIFGNLQVMRCLLCYNSLVHAFNPNTKERKWFITYYKTYGITTPKNMWIMIMQKLSNHLMKKQMF
jgi:hypothetical protein